MPSFCITARSRRSPGFRVEISVRMFGRDLTRLFQAHGPGPVPVILETRHGSELTASPHGAWPALAPLIRSRCVSCYSREPRSQSVRRTTATYVIYSGDQLFRV